MGEQWVPSKVVDLADVALAGAADGDPVVFDATSGGVKKGIGGSQTVLPASNGVDDTATLNAILANGGEIVARNGETYRISSPLIGPPGGKLRLDMTGAHIVEVAGSNCRMFQSYALATAGRDAAIDIVGGLWDRGANGGLTGADRHSIVLRKVDDTSVKGAQFTSTGGKFSVLFQNVTDYIAEELEMQNTASDGVHVNGPAVRGTIRSIKGTTGDDMVSIVPLDNAGYTWGDEGDITDLKIEDIQGVNCLQNLVKVLGGNLAGTPLHTKRVTVETVRGSCAHHGVVIGDGSDPNNIGGWIDAILVEDIDVQQGNGFALVDVGGTNIGRVFTEKLHYELGAATGQFAVLVPTGSVIYSLGIDDLSLVDGQTGIGVVRVQGSIQQLLIRAAMGQLVTGAALLELNSNVASIRGAMIEAANIAWATTSGSLISAVTTGQVLTDVVLADILCPNHPPSWIADTNVTTSFRMRGVKGTSRFNVRANGQVTIHEGSSDSVTNGSVVAVGGTLTSRSLGFWVDVSLLTPHVGDQAYNTNAALGCGVGPCVSDGVHWKNLYTGLTT